MSVAFDISPRVGPPHPALSRAEIRRGLVAMLRRRVPGQDVEDLAQTILCDALAAGAMPTDEEELRRWLTGIARHKVADFHRRAHRVTARSDGDAPLATCATAPAAFEEREVLHRLLGGLVSQGANAPEAGADGRSRRDAETMEWLVREHGGERLAEIAAEEELPAEVVRQRVSRLRRALRSRWSAGVGLLVLLAGAAAYALTRETVAIRPDLPEIVEVPATSQKPAPPPILDDLQGDWVVQAIHPDRELSAAEQKLANAYTKSAKVHIAGPTVDIVTTGFHDTWTVNGGNATGLDLTSDRGARDHVTVAIRRDKTGPHVDLHIAGHPKLGGTITLRRPIY